MTGVTPAARSLARAAASSLAGALALGSFAGCAGGTATTNPSEASPETTSSATDPTASPTDYLPVPAGVSLTEPGTQLGLGDAATVAWRPRQDTVVTLDLTVQRIDVTSYAESFEGWVVTQDMKDQTPYFVHLAVRNVGAADAGGLLVPLYGVDDTAILVEPLGFREEEFAPCPGGALPRRLAPGERTELCLVYLAPAGGELSAVAFDPAGELEPVSWAGSITRIANPGKRDEQDRDSGTG